MVFYNGEGDEVGGIVFDGRRSPSGTPSAGGGILFDRYKQDQIVGILYEEGNGRHAAGLHVWDRPDAPLSKLMDRLAEIEAMKTNEEKEQGLQGDRGRGLAGSRRVFCRAQRRRRGEARPLRSQGKPRLVARGRCVGNPSIQLLDENGKLVSEMPKGSSGGGGRVQGAPLRRDRRATPEEQPLSLSGPTTLPISQMAKNGMKVKNVTNNRPRIS